jgi:hypothetical protein
MSLKILRTANAESEVSVTPVRLELIDALECLESRDVALEARNN